MNVDIEMNIVATVDCAYIKGSKGHEFKNGQWYPEEPDEIIINHIVIGSHKIKWSEFKKVLNTLEINHIEQQVQEFMCE